MQAPKRKTSKSRKGTRRAHHGLVPKKISTCSNCSAPKYGYAICLECGYYNGKIIIPGLTS
ncbi:MAG TPA: 50S ribosomal protein L32 [Oligoflexia bacterium]|nr:50S ribosomal protein L32 [Oligoflexia bacterium]HMP47252.1 50S ribosomal protein L32 [Oligoflexia bacterium]